MRLLLLRHGQTHGNTAGALDTGEPGLDLTELGQSQAEAAARALAERGVDQIFVSSLVRTHQTAAPLAAMLGVEPCVLPGLREIYAGDFNMRDDHDAIAGYIGTVAAWIECRYDECMPGGETGHEGLSRSPTGHPGSVASRVCVSSCCATARPTATRSARSTPPSPART